MSRFNKLITTHFTRSTLMTNAEILKKLKEKEETTLQEMEEHDARGSDLGAELGIVADQYRALQEKIIKGNIIFTPWEKQKIEEIKRLEK